MANIQLGLMTRGQFPQGDDMQLRFEEMFEQIRLADKLGFSCITKGMHYSSWSLQDAQMVPYLSRVMAETKNMRLNMGIVLLALHKPLDYAELVATMDVLSGGRIIFGAALGYREVELKAFGVQKKEIVRRFTENIEAIKRLWTEETVTMKGSFFELDEASCSIKPLQKPRPPIWIGANADPAIERAAQLGDCWYVNPHSRNETLIRQLEVYKRALDAADRPFPKEFPMRKEVFVAETREKAIELAKPAIGLKYKVYHSWGQDTVMPEGDNNLDLDWEELLDDRFVLGSPAEVCEQLLNLHKTLGVNHIIASVQGAGMPQSQVLEALHMLGEEVLPYLKNA